MTAWNTLGKLSYTIVKECFLHPNTTTRIKIKKGGDTAIKIEGRDQEKPNRTTRRHSGAADRLQAYASAA
jgi:hypothetical protein